MTITRKLAAFVTAVLSAGALAAPAAAIPTDPSPSTKWGLPADASR